MSFNTRNNPWIKRGVDVSNLKTTSEAITQANLDWTVSKRPVYTNIDGRKVKIDNSYANVRDTDGTVFGGTVFGIMSKGYKILQNIEAFEFFDVLLGEGDAVIDRAGSFGKDDGKVWIQAHIPSHIRIGNTDDTIEKHMLLVNSHDGSSPVIVKILPFRIVCQNQLNMVLKHFKSDTVKIRHTKNMNSKLMQAKETLGIVNKVYDELDIVFNRMAEVDLKSEKNVDMFYNNVFNNGKEEVATRTKNTILDVKRLLDEGAGVDDPMMKQTRYSVWSVYNTVTEYIDHYKNFRNGTDKLESISIGTASKYKTKAFKEAVNLLN